MTSSLSHLTEPASRRTINRESRRRHALEALIQQELRRWRAAVTPHESGQHRRPARKPAALT